jgi:hypothetical protein
MIKCHHLHLRSKCLERGYTVNEVMPCVVAQDGDEWTVDVDHPAYPRTPKPGFVTPQPEPVPPSHGPGTEVKALLAKIGITASPDCKCNSRAAYMDKMEAEQPGWCEANIKEIVGWLRESAAERGLPFVDIAGRVLVRRAIHNARKAEAERAKEAEAAAAEGPAA